jgi:intein-encoded DNA endonuclease-like protein
MNVNLAIALTDIEGNKIQNEKGELMLLSKMVGNALFAAEEKEDPIRLYELAKKVYYSEGEIDLSKSDAELIKDKVKSKGFTVLVLGPLYEALK